MRNGNISLLLNSINSHIPKIQRIDLNKCLGCGLQDLLNLHSKHKINEFLFSLPNIFCASQTQTESQ